ncbi:methylcobamide:CoM methyltransferase MtaA [Methanohalophilus mahii]|uniref:Methyltransferase MtaA/CmuA family n=1 Tax=Methanohalophilus mahii (strain ATCC 35705 / DSM 5219 / SLP) TaxID=547558 RepID=D5E8N7_METMS|nr:methylcobamide:CoM methyltransferase MtaA [Methanohalophilus mahii]ADE35546.1 methyltransferase MtaA/CmuA family [Methanohalophilus mahii DSM 5219]
MQSGLRENLLNVLAGKEEGLIPVLSVTQTATNGLMETTGAFWPQAHSSAFQMAELSLAAHTVGGLEAISYPFCLTVLAEAAGCEIDLGTINRPPEVISHPFAEKVENPDIPADVYDRARVPVVLETTRRLRNFAPDVPLIAGMEGPATLVYHLIGAQDYLKWALFKPETFKMYIREATCICEGYAKLLFEAGADVICLDDTVAGPETLDCLLFETLIKPSYQHLTHSIEGPVVMHMCGNTTSILSSLANCGFEGISIEESVSVAEAKSQIGSRTILIGNISTTNTLLYSTPEEVEEEAFKCLEEGVDILAPGSGLAPETPVVNIRAMEQARDKYLNEFAEWS